MARRRSLISVRDGVAPMLLAALLILAPGSARAQRLGLEVGWAGVENYDPLNASFGLSFSVPLAERWIGSLTYTQWTGRDGNYRIAFGSSQGWTYFGNKGLNATLLYRVVDGARFSWAVGGGLGLYDGFSEEEPGERDHSVVTAGTVSTAWRYGLTSSTGIYLRGDISTRHLTRPHWGFLRLGLDWSPWN